MPRTVIPHDVIVELRAAPSSADNICYFTPSAAWIYNKFNGLVKLVVIDSPSMTNDVIYYDKYSKHYETHKNRILKLANND